MARPEIIALIHRAYYDLLWDSDNHLLSKAYQDCLHAAAAEFNCDIASMRRVVSKDFYQWCKQEGLQFPPRRN